MVMFITFGKYDSKYKYIIYYILTRLPFEYFFGNLFPDNIKIKYLRRDNFPNEIIIYDIFKYLTFYLLGFLFFKIEQKNQKNLILDTPPDILKKNTSLELIYNEKTELEHFSIKPVVHYIIIYILIHKLCKYYPKFGFLGLDFWMLQIIFMWILNIIQFKVKIYAHQKVAISIILIFSTLMKILQIISIFDSDENHVYKDYHWLIPIGILSLLILLFIESFLFYKAKWYLDLKFISEKKIIEFIGIFGCFISFVASLISTFIKCGNDEFSSRVCLVSDEGDLYFDNYKVFFSKIWMSNRNPFVNIVYIIILFIKLFCTFLYAYFTILIIKNLSPEHMICSDSILYFIKKVIVFIYYISIGQLTKKRTFDTLAQLFSLLGTIIYLEIIELNFCGLNFNLKNKIRKRGQIEALKLSKEILKESENELYSDDA